MILIRMKFIAAGVCTILTFACAAPSAEHVPPLQIEGMVMENHTQMWVSAVRLLVPVTGNFVSCGNMSPGTVCSTTFPETTYTGNAVEITWSQGGQIHSTGAFVIALPADLKEELPMVVHIVIAGPGSAGAVFVQRQGS